MRFGALVATALLAFCGSAVFVDEARAAGVPRGFDGRFDYWVLALSWSPQHCATTQKPDTTQCGAQRSYGFVVHGLWPQYERGFPSSCGKAAYVPEALIDSLLPIMPSKPLILHEWRKHGTCSGLDAQHYFGKLRQVFEKLRIPSVYRALDQPLLQAPQQIESEWMRSNPGLQADGIALQCSGRYFSELRICYDRQMDPRACGRDLDDRCGAQALFRPLR